VTVFDDTGLTLLDGHHRGDTGLDYRVYNRESESDRAFLRVDDGHRFVGLEVPWSELEASGISGPFRWLERELGDRRRLDPEPGNLPPAPLLTGQSPEEFVAAVTAWRALLPRMGEVLDRAALGDVEGRAERYRRLTEQGTVFWLPDPPADPDAPTPERAGGVRLRRTCYDKPHRCPGWAGGGWRYPRPSRDVCDGGSLVATMYVGRWWRWRFHRCPTCGTWAWPPVTKWADPTWLWFVAARPWQRLRERWADRSRE
jgi:hypothetical protein